MAGLSGTFKDEPGSSWVVDEENLGSYLFYIRYLEFKLKEDYAITKVVFM